MSEITKDSVTRSRVNARKIAVTAIFTAMAVVLMYLEFSLPFVPPFLKFDFSELPVLIGSFALGPVYGIVIELLKNLIHLPVTGTSGIGEPLYGSVLNYSTEAIVGMSSAVNPLITDKTSLVLWAFLPFNLFKGLVIGFITFWVYKPISKLINSTYKKTR